MPDPTLEARITRLPVALEPERGAEAAAVLPAGPLRDLAAAAAGSSPHLHAVLTREAVWAADALAGPPEAARDALLAEAEAVEGDPGVPLRRLKRRLSLLVALADLGGAWPLEAVTAALTEFADRAVETALAHALAREVARGRLLEDPGAVILAMGKMGAFELNYSSDIDLIALFDGARIPPSDHAEARAALIRAVRAACRTLSDVTAEGQVFRTDLRLRPDPSVTPVILPMDAAERYYESLARTWERAAHIKARPCAGDLAAGRAYLDRLKPFVWRRHLDFAAIEDVHDLVRRIRGRNGRGLGPIEARGHDLKLGLGGIREVELTVQSRQLIWGGRDPSLRAPGTVVALDALARAGRLPEEAAVDLAGHYRALRDAEHRLQMIRDAQTQTVPEAGADLDRLARLHGEPSTAAFVHALTERLATVHRWTEALIGPPERGPRRAPPERWAAYPALRSARARAGFERIAGPLMERIEAAPRPEEATAAFDRFLAGLPAGAQLFALFEANPSLLDLIVDVASAAPALAEHLAREAAVLDAVIGGDFFAPWPGEAALAAELAALMAREADHEARLDAARGWARERRFQVGVHHLRGLCDGDAAGARYADLAGAVVRALLPVVEADLARRHGPAPGRGACVLAMGSLGAGWLHAGSDLDLIMVYDAAGEEASDGPRPLAARAWHARLAQALVTALTAPMSRGRLYEVDMRLRPSGRQGPVATSLDAFRDYQMREAWVWERLALTRARSLAGPADLLADVEAVRLAALAAAPPPDVIAQGTADMRRRLAEAKAPAGPWDVREGPGGMRDAELIGQARALAAGDPMRDTPSQLGPGPLAEAYRLQRRVRAAATLLAPGGFAPEAVGRTGLEMVLREAGAGDLDALAADLASARDVASREGGLQLSCLGDRASD